jgi:hypothetical protein
MNNNGKKMRKMKEKCSKMKMMRKAKMSMKIKMKEQQKV